MPDGVAGNTEFTIPGRVIDSSSNFSSFDPVSELIVGGIGFGAATNNTAEASSFFNLTDFDFQVPSDVVITGIQFLFNCYQQGGGAEDEKVYFTASLEFDGIVSNQQIESSASVTANEPFTMGSPTNLLGFTSLTPASVNDITMSFSAYNSSSFGYGYNIYQGYSPFAIDLVKGPSIKIWYVPPYYENELSVFSGELSLTSGKLSVL